MLILLAIGQMTFGVLGKILFEFPKSKEDLDIDTEGTFNSYSKEQYYVDNIQAYVSINFPSWGCLLKNITSAKK